MLLSPFVPQKCHVKCGMPRVKKEDDSVGRCFKNIRIPESEQIRADGAVDEGSWGEIITYFAGFLSTSVAAPAADQCEASALGPGHVPIGC